MGLRLFGLPALAVAGITIAAIPLTGQTPSSSTTAKTAKAGKAWTPPRTADGQPDLSGTWTHATYTPVERPPEFAGKEFWTPEEAAAYEKQRVAQFLGQATDNIHYDDAIWQTEPYGKGVTSLRTSLITDPKDGRIPPQTPEALKRAAERAARRGNPADAIQNRTLAERCITWGNDVPPLMPVGYNSNLQIMQGANYVVIITEMIHTARIIPLDGRPHLGENLRQLIGDSRGHWEGNTLVVDTTNFTDKTGLQGLERKAARDRALHPRRRRLDQIRVHGRRSDDVDAILECRDSDAEDGRADLRVRLQRRQLRHREHSEGRPSRGEGQGASRY